jgi:cysteine desulfurase
MIVIFMNCITDTDEITLPFMDKIYLDNAATTPVDERVADAMIPYLKGKFGNASSVHSIGREAKVLLEDTRDLVAYNLGVRPSEIYFTSGASEANNFAVKGMAFSMLWRTAGIKKSHIISSKIEHPSVIDTLGYLKERFGFNISFIENDNFGVIDLQSLKDLITDDTFLICVMHANNEIGIINNVSAVSEITGERKIHLHTDCVQSFGKIPFKINDIGANTVSISAHKIYGPKGIGALYIKRDTNIDKLIHGGKQERGRRGGTENIACIAGFKKAIEILKDDMESDAANYKKLKTLLVENLKNDFGDKIIYNSVTGQDDSHKGLNNILNFSFDPVKIKTDPETLLIKLDMRGIEVSSGSACSSGTVKPSHVIKALGWDDKTAATSIRVSFGRFNTDSDVNDFSRVLKEIVN